MYESLYEPHIRINVSARRIALLNNIILYIYLIFRVSSGNFGGEKKYCIAKFGYEERCVIYDQTKDSLELKLRGLLTFFNCVLLIIVNHSLRISTSPSLTFLKKAIQIYIVVLVIYIVNTFVEYRSFSIAKPYEHEYALILIIIIIYHTLYYGVMVAEVWFVFYPTYLKMLQISTNYDEKFVNPM